MGDVPPVQQHPYRVSPVKRWLLRVAVTYILGRGIAKPSSSSWSLWAGLMACVFFAWIKVNAIIMPDSFPLPCLDGCIDQVGSVVFVTKLDLLKGYW